PPIAPPPLGSEMTEPAAAVSVVSFALIAASLRPRRALPGPADDQQDVVERTGAEQRVGIRAEVHLPVPDRTQAGEGYPGGRVAPAGARDAVGGRRLAAGGTALERHHRVGHRLAT